MKRRTLPDPKHKLSLRRDQLKKALLEKTKQLVEEAELQTDPDLLNTSDFWGSHQSGKISYDLLHDTFIHNEKFTIDTALQEILIEGFYTLFPGIEKSNEGLNKTQIKKKEKLQACWRFIFLNTCNALRDRRKAISVSLDKNKYNKGEKFHCEYWGYNELQQVTKRIVLAGYFKKYRGRNYDDEEKSSYITRFEILPGFHALIESYVERNKESNKGFLPDGYTGYDFILTVPFSKPEKPLLVIKDNDGNRTIPSRGNRSVDQMHKRVEKYNEFMQQQEILIGVDLENTKEENLKTLLYAIYSGELSVVNPEVVYEAKRPSTFVQSVKDINTFNNNYNKQININNNKLNKHINNNTTPNNTTHQLYPVKPSPLFCNNSTLKVPNDGLLYLIQNRYRCFRGFKNSIKEGGRFYGIVNQGIPENVRLNTLINGHKVVELDYSGLHPSLLYSRLSIQPLKDIYVYDKTENKLLRDLIKSIALIIFNEGNEIRAIKAIRKDYSKKHDVFLTDDNIKLGIEVFFDLNPELEQFKYKQIGLELQYLDSQMMDRILTKLLKIKTPAIPIHDSIIVPAQNRAVAYDIMIEAYQYMTKTKHVPFISV